MFAVGMKYTPYTVVGLSKFVYLTMVDDQYKMHIKYKHSKDIKSINQKYMAT